MTDYEPDGNERIDSRTERALTQYLTVLADVGRATGADDLFLVVSQSGSEYLVDTREGRCECDDHHYRGVRCKHLRRVAFATGERPVPASVDGVDPQLGGHTDETPRRAVSDGGVVETTTTPPVATTATSGARSERSETSKSERMCL